MICACGYVQPCVPLEGNTYKSCGDMTDRLSGVDNLETHMQDCRKPIPLTADFRLEEIIHAMHQAQAWFTTKGPSHLSHVMGSVVCWKGCACVLMLLKFPPAIQFSCPGRSLVASRTFAMRRSTHCLPAVFWFYLLPLLCVLGYVHLLGCLPDHSAEAEILFKILC